ncbi:MAG TPA: acetate/propionate family kinase [Candidatus Angelobacter sp.]|nr:acetate/propionate family kinase [Candidatus Angelobacter sp.]
MEQLILSLNGGSSSLKFATYRMEEAAEERVFSGAIEAIGTANGRAWLKTSKAVVADQRRSFPDHAAAIKAMFAALQQQGVTKLAAAGHRIVHGGPKFSTPQQIDDKLKRALKELISFAPLHLPSQLAMIDAITAHYPEMPQIACFDTSFHSSIPEVAQRFALPEKFWQQGIKRYGFHGLSYEYVVAKLGKELGRRAIIAHLGNGASMVALKGGQPIDTSMGLTPTGGFMMGTRSGDLDPGVLLYLLRQGYSADQLETLLNHQSGLLGVSGQTSEMKILLDRRSSDPAAALAVRMFSYQICKYAGAFAAALGGLDTLVFTGGIGERAAQVRADVCQGLEHLGINLDNAANAKSAAIISSSNSRCLVRVVETDEDLMIALHTRTVLFAAKVQ